MRIHLEPTPARVEAARRAAGRNWTFGAEGPTELTTNPVLAELALLGVIVPHYVTPQQQIAGQDDYYRLTEAGREWLDSADQGGGVTRG